MADQPTRSSKHALDPIDRISEVLFGLIMVLTVTSSLSIAEAGRDSIRTMLAGAIGCNLAWGIIDSVLYLMGCLAEKGRDLKTLQALRSAADSKEARILIADALPSVVAAVLQPTELEMIRQRLQELPPPEQPRLRKEDWSGAATVFLLVFLSTFPVVIPFLCMRHAAPALLVSSAIATGLLFLVGCAFGRLTARRPLRVGIAMVLLCVLLVGLAKALGG